MGIDHGTIKETYEDKRRRETVEGLRKMADFIEAHPDLPTPFISDAITNVTVWKSAPVPSVLADEYDWPETESIVDEEATTRELARCVQAMGECEKVYTDSYFELHKKFSDRVKLQYYANRQSVCKKIVKGTKVIPARIVEDVEWECSPISFKGFSLDD